MTFTNFALEYINIGYWVRLRVLWQYRRMRLSVMSSRLPHFLLFLSLSSSCWPVELSQVSDLLGEVGVLIAQLTYFNFSTDFSMSHLSRLYDLLSYNIIDTFCFLELFVSLIRTLIQLAEVFLNILWFLTLTTMIFIAIAPHQLTWY